MFKSTMSDSKSISWLFRCITVATFCALSRQQTAAWAPTIDISSDGNTCHYKQLLFQTKFKEPEYPWGVTRIYLSRALLVKYRNCSQLQFYFRECLCLFNIGKTYGNPVIIESVDSPRLVASAVVVEGHSLLVDPLFASYKQFGHYMSKLLQVFHALQRMRYKQVAFLRGTGFAACESHLCELERFCMQSTPVTHPGQQLTLLESADAPRPIDYETTFWTFNDWVVWRQHLKSVFPELHFEQCPKPNVYVLSRNVTGRARNMLNLEGVGQALKYNGINCFKHLFFNSSWEMKTQMAIFNRAGLVIATHGSYFKNMVYASPSSVFIEVAALDTLNHHQPWALGTDVSDVIFVSSNNHGGEGDCQSYQRCDVQINATLLAATIANALQKQAERGCDIRGFVECKNLR